MNNNVQFISNTTVLFDSYLASNANTILGQVSDQYTDGVTLYIVNNSTFSTATVTVTITNNNGLVYSNSYFLAAQKVSSLINISNIATSTVSISVYGANSCYGYLVYNSSFASLPNNNFSINDNINSSNITSTEITLTLPASDYGQENILAIEQFILTNLEPMSSDIDNWSSQITTLQTDINSLSDNVNSLYNSLDNKIISVTQQTSNQISTVESNFNTTIDSVTSQTQEFITTLTNSASTSGDVFQILDTIDQLRNSDFVIPTVRVLGYYEPGDGGGDLYYSYNPNNITGCIFTATATPIPNPDTAPTVTVNSTVIDPLPGLNFTIPNGPLYVAIAYVSEAGESTISPITTVTVNGTTITVTSPSNTPEGVLHYAVYMGTTATTLYLQKLYIDVGTDWVQPPTVGIFTWSPQPLETSGIGSLMTVTSIQSGSLHRYALLTSPSLLNSTYVASQLSGTTGSTGVYVIRGQQTFSASNIILDDGGCTYILTNSGNVWLRNPDLERINILCGGAIGDGIVDDAWVIRTAATNPYAVPVFIPNGKNFYMEAPILKYTYAIQFNGTATISNTMSANSIISMRTSFFCSIPYSGAVSIKGIAFHGGFNPLELTNSGSFSTTYCRFVDWSNTAIIHNYGEKYIFENLQFAAESISPKIAISPASQDLSLIYSATNPESNLWIDRCTMKNLWTFYSGTKTGVYHRIQNFIYTEGNIGDTDIQNCISSNIAYFTMYIRGQLQGTTVSNLVIDLEGWPSRLETGQAIIYMEGVANSTFSNFPIGNGSSFWNEGVYSVYLGNTYGQPSAMFNNISFQLPLFYNGTTVCTFINCNGTVYNTTDSTYNIVTDDSKFINCSMDGVPGSVDNIGMCNNINAFPSYNLIPNASFILGGQYWNCSVGSLSPGGLYPNLLNQSSSAEYYSGVAAVSSLVTITSETVLLYGSDDSICAWFIASLDTSDTTNGGLMSAINFYNSSGSLISSYSLTTITSLSPYPTFIYGEEIAVPSTCTSFNFEFSFNSSTTDPVIVTLYKVKVERSAFCTSFTDDATLALISGNSPYNINGIYNNPTFGAVTSSSALVNGPLTVKSITNTSNTNSVASPTLGTVESFNSYNGTYKVNIYYLDGYENGSNTDQTLNFPTAYLYPPIIKNSAKNSSGSAKPISVSTAGISLLAGDTTTYTGYIQIEGF